MHASRLAAGVRRVVVMGVAGSGKSTVGRALAADMGVPFVDADEFHSPAAVAKMASGRPLSESERRPWLSAVCDALDEQQRVVCACSALTRAARDELRRAGGVVFVHLVVDRSEAELRTTRRKGHFMGPAMVASQFDTLEPPGPDETDVVPVDAGGPLSTVLPTVEQALLHLQPLTDGAPPGPG